MEYNYSNSFKNIIKIIWSAFVNTPNIYRSIVGYNIYDNYLIDNNSEYYKENWNLFEMIQLWSDIFLPKLPFSPPKWLYKPVRKLLFGKKSKFISAKPDICSDGICIFYVNGILSNVKVVMQSKNLLENLLNRPVNVIYNATDCFLIDIIECLIGKETESLTEASSVALFTISKKILDPKVKKIIIISHSQGTIITGKMLSSLVKIGLDKEKYLEKIEIYAFSNCCSKMNYLTKNLPKIESFANEFDFVGKLGCNNENDVSKYISIDGDIFINKNNYGHMFNTHYINNFVNDYPSSNLINYIVQ